MTAKTIEAQRNADLYIATGTPPAQPERKLTTCNCRWDGDVQVQQCTLHESHIAAIRDWAERAKTAEKRLAETSPQPAAPQPETVFQHEVADKFASDRYRVVKSRSTIWPNSVVVAGDGEQELFSGSNSACKHVARKLVGAFLDGAFYTHSFTAQTVRKPMTRVQALNLVERVRMRWATSPPTYEMAPAVVRAVEEWHDIKGTP